MLLHLAAAVVLDVGPLVIGLVLLNQKVHLLIVDVSLIELDGCCFVAVSRIATQEV